MTIQERINYLMKKQNISKAELARRIGKPYTTVDNWFKRNSSPNSEVITNLANALNTTSEWLITGIDIGTTTPDEQQLLNYYNKSNQEGKSRIMEQAEFIAQKYPAQGKSSDCKIG